MEMKTVSKKIITNRWFVLGAAAVILYALLGFFLLPYLASNYLREYVNDRLDRELAVENLRFNPFTFKVEAEGLGLEEKKGPSLLTVGSFSADFDLFSSLWQQAWTFGNISISHPILRIVVKKSGRSNIAELFKDLQPDEKKQTEAADTSLPSILVEQVDLDGGKVNFVDRRTSPPAEVHFKSVALNLEELTTLPDRTGDYLVSGRTKLGELLKWRGNFSLNPLSSKGSLRMENVKAATVWEFLKDRISSAAPTGEVTLTSDYQVDLEGPQSVLALSNLDFDASHLSISLPGKSEPIVSLAEVAGRQGRLQWNERTFRLESLLVKGGQVEAKVDENGLADWQKLLPDGQKATAAASDKQRGTGRGSAPIQNPPTEWSGVLQSFKLKNFQMHLTDLTTEPSAALTLSSLELTLEGLATNPASPVNFDLQATVTRGGTISASGTAKPWRTAADGTIQVKDFSLLPLQPYLSQRAHLTLESGNIAVSGEFSYSGTNDNNSLSYRGEGNISSFKARGPEEDQPSWGWDSLSCPEIHLSLSPDLLDLGAVDLVGLQGRVVIYQDGKWNLSKIMVGDKTDGEEKSQSPQSAFKVTVDRVRLKQGSMEFSDLSLSPNFDVLIHELEGGVTGISSVPETLAKFELQGKVDNHGMVKIKGKSDFFNPTDTTAVTMDFRNIEMTQLTPYSVHFAGYRIASGKLYLDLGYSIQNGRMEGTNEIVAKKLKLGERVESPTALDLPIELAIALLKDANGTIDIALPISGNLKNPKFDMGAVMGKALSNFIVKIVTKPFTWLASLAGSNRRDLETVSFDPGRSSLLPPEEEKLDDLSQALADRPQLRLKIQGGYDREADMRALKAIQANRKLASEKGQTPQPEGDLGPIVFHDPETQKALEAIFLQYFSRDKLSELREAFEDKLPSGKNTTGKKDGPAAWAGFYHNLYDRIEERMEIPENRLPALGRERADAVRRFLVGTQDVDPKRIEVLDPVQTKKKSGKEVASKLTLDAPG